ncbi:MAG: hypothetical protein RJA99_2043 [Pseudomonadota bacterium]|jgi:uncharacterized protein (TIGR02099 family)
MTASPTPLSSRLAGILLGLLGVVLGLVLVAYLGVRHVLWPRIDAWRPELVAQLERQLGRAVAIDALHPEWKGLHPALRIDGLRIDGADGAPRLEVASAYARVSWRAVARGAPGFAELRLEAPRVVVERLGAGRFAVAGIELPGTGPSDDRAADWLLTQGAIDVRDAEVEVLDRTGALEPLRVGGVTLALRATGRRHRASLSIADAGDAAGPLSAVAEIYRPPFSRPSDWRRWDGTGHLSGRDVDLARVAALVQAFGAALPGPVATAEGRVDLLAWLRVDDATVVDATVKARAGRAATRLDDGRLDFDAIEGELRVERLRDGGHVLRVARLSAVDAEGFALAADGDAEIRLDAARGLRSAWLRLKAFDAGGALSAVRRLPLPATVRERIAGIGLSGDVRDLTLRWSRPDAPAPELRPADRSDDALRARAPEARFELSASFERLGVQLGESAGHRLPGAGNLSGTVRASEHEGTLTLASSRAVVALPGYLDEPLLAFDRLDAELDWVRDPADAAAPLRVTLQRLAFASPDARGTAQGSWRGGAVGPGSADLSARLEQADVRRVARYLPSWIAKPARDWVEHALLGGTGDEVRIQVRGDLRDFPFHAPSEGRFRIVAAVRDLTLDYAPQWPRIEQARGEVTVDGDGIEVRASQAVTEGVRLADVVARLPVWHEGQLAIEGRAAGLAQDMLRFVNGSPVASTVSAFTRDLRIGGDARLGMKLALPLWDLAASRVAGTVELAGNEVQLDATLPPFGAVAGRVEFSERGVSLPELRGTFLGGPIRVEGRPAGEGRMRIDASGSIDAAGARQLVDNALTRRLEGRTDYRASVDVDRRASTLRIESDLVGLTSTLPAPFAKAAGQVWPLRVVSRPIAPPDAGSRPPGDRIDVRLRDDVAVLVEREREAGTERLAVRRAGFGLGTEPALRDGGLSVLVRARTLDVDAWRAVVGGGELERLQRDVGGRAAAGFSLVPDLVSVVADDLTVAGRDLHEVVVGATREAGRWRANVVSREIEGHFDWRDARPGERIGTLVARFARLVLPRSREGEVESALSASPSQLPALDVVADELVLGTLPMGRLELAATNGGSAERPVWKLDRLILANPSARLEAHGAWSFVGVPRERRGAPVASLGSGSAGVAPEPAPDARSTTLEFELEVRDAGRLLDGLGLRETVHGGSGSLGGSVHWHGSPIGLDYGSLDGRVTLALGRGEFLKVDPGVAKLIGVLNMQSLPKRLSGDFRDLFGEGFAFDAINGSVRIDDGVARTDDLKMRGLQAQVAIRGEADLRRETQRLSVEVVPQLNAGLASLAVGAMINPLIGLGSFAAQYVLQKPLQQALAYEVDVTGSWSDPTVSERSRRSLQAPAMPRP